jgi:hypothetical protein
MDTGIKTIDKDQEQLTIDIMEWAIARLETVAPSKTIRAREILTRELTTFKLDRCNARTAMAPERTIPKRTNPLGEKVTHHKAISYIMRMVGKTGQGQTTRGRYWLKDYFLPAGQTQAR